VVADAAPARAPVRADPLLALRHRVTVLPASAAQRVGRLLGPLFLRPVWVLLVAAFLAGAVWIARHDLLGALVAGVRQTALQPGYVLAILALTVAGAAFHECGHVAACSYGGARPGDLGVGLYVLWPAFYSTVTDSYRLGRAGRVRTDLGGIYFNVVFMAGVEAVHLATGCAWLLIALVGMLVQTGWQFLPSLRLDGYYVLADLVGVPELFGFVTPALLSLLPGRPVHPGVLALRPAARRWVQAWVLAAVPTLLAGVVALVLALPRLVPAALQAAGAYVERLGAAARGGDVVAAGAGVLQLLLLALPWVGLLLLLGSLGRLLARPLLRWRSPGPGRDRAGHGWTGRARCRGGRGRHGGALLGAARIRRPVRSPGRHRRGGRRAGPRGAAGAGCRAAPGQQA
jgi:putative peptide zinc metalloprotease protein